MKAENVFEKSRATGVRIDFLELLKYRSRADVILSAAKDLSCFLRDRRGPSEYLRMTIVPAEYF
jgi:hypothetical protein